MHSENQIAIWFYGDSSLYKLLRGGVFKSRSRPFSSSIYGMKSQDFPGRISLIALDRVELCLSVLQIKREINNSLNYCLVCCDARFESSV